MALAEKEVFALSDRENQLHPLVFSPNSGIIIGENSSGLHEGNTSTGKRGCEHLRTVRFHE